MPVTRRASFRAVIWTALQRGKSRCQNLLEPAVARMSGTAQSEQDPKDSLEQKGGALLWCLRRNLKGQTLRSCLF